MQFTLLINLQSICHILLSLGLTNHIKEITISFLIPYIFSLIYGSLNFVIHTILDLQESHKTQVRGLPNKFYGA